MEELSVEQKAKAYDKAIEKANSLLSGNQLGNAWIYKLLPELKESDDERIRKEIISYLKQRLKMDSSIPVAIGYWITWLEKQGEQKSEEEVDNLHNYLYGEQKFSNNQFTLKQASVLDKHIDKFLEQKPTWSEDDERIRQDIENLIHFSLRDGSAVSPVADTTKEDAISWIQSLKERVQPQNK